MALASLHLLFAQQGLLAEPQTVQMFVELSQAAVASLHPVGFAVVAVQQVSPKEPQDLHVERPVELLYKHWFAGSLHAVVVVDVIEQQGWPGPPHSLHEEYPVELLYWHCVPGSVQDELLQHGPSCFPQAWQVLTVVPLLVVLDPQARS